MAGTREAIGELTGTLADLATQAGIVTGLVDTISRAMSRVPTAFQRRSFIADTTDSFVDYQTRMVTASKEIARITQEMVIFILISFTLCQCNLFPMG